ncbi:MarR family winged helix-turn-helix transcriptional regulator [Trinickia dinghuensis]|uniref:MarR family transcriptional regulator n=1 Tax=Trinickia dinghuensis TaxID=2291023 RepID=A0A3D8K666_9BURK|nr:MarR family transcriptional regulator [Trinickia dinghuensis]RDV00908.1 MarR family transcriptional regulator [Trinickia dinghuensis]
MSAPPAKPSSQKSAARSDSEPTDARSQRRLIYLVAHLDRLLRRRMSGALAPLEITLAQYTALSVLEARGALSNAQLAERSFITPQSANEVMSAMVSRGYVAREAAPSHGRIILLRLTDEGAAALRECERALRPVERAMAGDLTAADAAQLRHTLTSFVHNLSD